MNRSKRIYLDHSATTPVDPRVVEVMSEFMLEKYGNPSSVHFFGREAKEALDFARISVAKLLDADSDDIFFTSGGTEADNLALLGYCKRNRHKGDHVIVSSIEHSAVLRSAKELENDGFRVTRLQPDGYGEITAESVEKAMTEGTILVSIMHANNEVGTINDLAEISKVVHQRKAVFHTDAVQSYGKVPISVEKMGVDMLSLSAHKIYGPKGIGALYIHRGVEISSRQFGGHQESEIRPGTENIPGIVGLGIAADICHDEMQSESSKLKYLRDELWNRLRSGLERVTFNGHVERRMPGNLSVTFHGVEGEAMLVALDLEGVSVSSGSACSSGSTSPSHVLTEIGLTPQAAHSTLRMSLGRSNTIEDIERAANIIIKSVIRLRFMDQPFTETGSQAMQATRA